MSHLWEGGFDGGSLGPDGDVGDGVAVGYAGLGKALHGGGRCEGVDGGDVAVSIAEARGVPSSGGGGGVAADVDGGFLRNGEEGGFDQGVELLRLGGIGGLVGEAGRLRKEALAMSGEVGIEGLDEVGGGGGGLA